MGRAETGFEDLAEFPANLLVVLTCKYQSTLVLNVQCPPQLRTSRKVRGILFEGRVDASASSVFYARSS